MNRASYSVRSKGTRGLEGTNQNIMTTKFNTERLEKERNTLTQLETDINGVASQITRLQAQVQHDLDTGVDDADSRGRNNKLAELRKRHKKLDKDFQDQTALVARLAESESEDDIFHDIMHDYDEDRKEKIKETFLRSSERFKGPSGNWDDEAVWAMFQAMSMKREAGSTTTAPLIPPTRTRSLATLPSLQKASAFLDHLIQVKAYFRLNGVTGSLDQKDLLMASFNEAMRLRAGHLDTSKDPYASMSFNDFAEMLRKRFIPKASSSILRQQFTQYKQAPGDNVIDYILKKAALFQQGWDNHSMPFNYLLRAIIEGIYNNDIKEEMWRRCSSLEDSFATDEIDIRDNLEELMEIANQSLDFVRKKVGSTVSSDRQGLGITSAAQTDKESITNKHPAPMQKISHLDLQNDGEQEEGDYCGEHVDYQEGEEEEIDGPLDEETILLCEQFETPEQREFWGTSEELEQINELDLSKTRCFVCGVLGHVRLSCPQRFKSAHNRIGSFFSRGSAGRGRRRSGRGYRRAASWTRGWGAGTRGRSPATPMTQPSSSRPSSSFAQGPPSYFPNDSVRSQHAPRKGF